MADPRDIGRAQLGGRRRLTIPEDVVNFLGLKSGDTLVFSKHMKGRVVIRGIHR